MQSKDSATEPYRPQFHFTPPRGWINDPNGLVFFRGEWHLFYQFADLTPAGGMLWGHAVSADLIHWQHLRPAIVPDRHGAIWSGSAVVDHHDSSGLFNGEAGMVCVFTYFDSADGFQSQGLAYSGDGRTFQTYAGNPVIDKLPGDKDFRDPKVFWHAPTSRWVMAVAGGKLRIYSSSDLIEWRFESVHDEIWTECPDLFALPVDGDTSDVRWLLSGGGRWYQLGEFDGRSFAPTSPRHVMDYGPDFYATQTWSDAPADRRIAISWLFMWNYESNANDGKITNAFPTSPWSGGSLSVPTELSLRTTPQGVRLHQTPVPELDQLRRPLLSLSDLTLRPGDANPVAAVRDKALDVRLDLAGGAMIAVRIPAESREYVVTYDGQQRLLSIDRTGAHQPPVHFNQRYDAPLPLRADGTLSLRLLIDHSSVEIFVNDGALTMSAYILPDPAAAGLSIEAVGGECGIKRLQIDAMRPAL